MAEQHVALYGDMGVRFEEQAAKTLKNVYPVTLFNYKYSDAVEYLCKAGLCYSIAKRFNEAGVMYEQAALHEQNLGATVSAASLYHEAAKWIEKDNPHHALMCYSKAINAYCQIKRFTTAAKLEIDSARFLEEDKNFKGAREHWQRAENLICTSGENDAWATRCQLRVAEHTLRCQDFSEAAHMFEQVGVASLSHNLLKFNVPGHFMLALLCMFATCNIQRSKAMFRRLKKHSKGDGSLFWNSREYVFASTLLQIIENGDIDSFANHVYAFDNACKLNSWTINILDVIRAVVERKAEENRR